MAITITAFAPKGQPIHTTTVATMRDARAYCALDATPRWVDGFSIAGIGIVRVRRNADGSVRAFSRLLNGEFAEGTIDEMVN